MYVVCVQARVKPEYIDEFIRVSQANHDGTRSELGNVRWDFLQAEDDPTRFFIFEVYKTKEDFPKHHQTEHYLKWRETVADWMAEPRTAIKYFNVYPADADWDK